MKVHARHGIGSLLTLATLVVAGCVASDLPTRVDALPESEPASPMYASESGPNVSELAQFSAPRLITSTGAKKWIGPEGGRLDFEGFAIDVPAGAVDEVTQFSIRLPADAEASVYVLAEFGPHQTFAVPVAIELPYAGTTVLGKAATIVWWDPDAARWVDMGAGETADGQRLRTETDHFSDYGTTEEKGDAVILSGG